MSTHFHPSPSGRSNPRKLRTHAAPEIASYSKATNGQMPGVVSAVLMLLAMNGALIFFAIKYAA
ncbi:hypothetical protein ACFQI3_05730 [Hansschlegelia quercus]|uniref:Uncharacterized protein n=1 Tax=Hansschlegelia quercus TaxID=2528245 RepID=A0A4Q9GPS8_9HYPH|nr:hypothetical protein [Hansschlegelia quercus]TBN53930.1 hypothetical protein EYR15_09115 [Hansschlegelia quercus]